MKKIFLFALLLLAGQISLSAQCFLPLNCPANPLTFCDTSTNNALLWNDSLFFDPAVHSQDLSDTPVNLSMQVTDTCMGIFTANYVLSMDLNGDGVMETTVSSLNLPSTDVVYFGNTFNPNYSGGEPRHFDGRPVPPEQKYIFALEQTVVGNVHTARVRWTTAADPTTFVDPQLPYGTFRIKWYFDTYTNMNFDAQVCNSLFTVKDCKAPVVTCQSDVTVNMPPIQHIQFLVNDFLQSSQDNYTPTAQLAYGVREAGTGTGFPVDGQGNPIPKVVYTCANLGLHPLEIWSRDLSGNANYCTVNVNLVDTINNCADPTITACTLSECNGKIIPDLIYELSGSSNAVPPFIVSFPPDSIGCIDVSNAIPLVANATIRPVKDNNPLDGVNTLDLVLITRHLLGVENLDSPYKLIAAAANKANPTISAFNIQEIRKLILGVYQGFPDNSSWRFVESSFVFPNPQNPFQTVFPESVTSTPTSPSINASFDGVKIGDVNCTALEPVTPPAFIDGLSIPNLALQNNEVVEVPVSFLQAKDYYGFQFGLHLDPALVEIQAVLPDVVTQANFFAFSNSVNISWSAPILTTFMPNQPLFHLLIRALQPLHLTDAISIATGDLRAEAYPSLETDSLAGLQLQFATVAITEPGNDQGIFAPQPNPTTAGVLFPLHLEQSATVNLEILDATGRLVYQRQQAVGSGAQWMDVPATALSQTGVYFWRVQAGEMAGSGKIVRQ